MAPNNESGHPDLTCDDQLPPPEPVNPNKLTTTCHCGRISVEMPSPPTIVNECQCSICYRYGAMWAYYSQEDVNVFVNIPAPASGPEGGRKPQEPVDPGREGEGLSGLRGYVRGDFSKGTIGFFTCAHCGCMTHWAATEKGKEYMRENPRKDDLKAPWIGVNCRMLPPRLLEGVERRRGKAGDF